MDQERERARLEERLAHYSALATEYPDGPIAEVTRDVEKDLKKKTPRSRQIEALQHAHQNPPSRSTR